MNTLERGPSTGDKVGYAALGLFMVAFLISVPFMIRDRNKLKQQQWQEQGCRMNDDYKPANIPAKCSSYFIDHYQPQQERVQPPEQGLLVPQEGGSDEQ